MHCHGGQELVDRHFPIHIKPEYGIIMPGQKSRFILSVCFLIDTDQADSMLEQKDSDRISFRFFCPLHIERYKPAPHEYLRFLFFFLSNVMPV